MRLSTLEKLWDYQVGSAVYANLCCDDIDQDGQEELIVLTNDDRLLALSHEGQLKWQAYMKPKSMMEDLFLDHDSIRIGRSSPVTADINGDGRKEIIVGSRNKSVYAFDADGKKLWEYATKGPINSTAAVKDIDGDGDPEIIIGSDDGTLYALNNYGNLIWKREIGQPIESKIRIKTIHGSPVILFGAKDNNLYALDKDGTIRWKYQTEGAIHGAPAVGDITNSGTPSIIIGSSDSYIYSLDPKGRLNWKFKTGGTITSDVVLSNLRPDKLDIVLGICSMQENLLVLSGKTNIVKRFDAGFWVASAPLILTSPENEKRIVFGSYDNHLYIVPFSPGGNSMNKKMLRFNTNGIIVGQPAVSAEGKIYTANKNGSIVCLREIMG